MVDDCAGVFHDGVDHHPVTACGKSFTKSLVVWELARRRVTERLALIVAFFRVTFAGINKAT